MILRHTLSGPIDERDGLRQVSGGVLEERTQMAGDLLRFIFPALEFAQKDAEHVIQRVWVQRVPPALEVLALTHQLAAEGETVQLLFIG